MKTRNGRGAHKPEFSWRGLFCTLAVGGCSCAVSSLLSACHSQSAGEQTGANSMFVTEDEAAAMYARACRSWYGPKAKLVAKSKVCSLRARGDDKGVIAWQKVVDALEREHKAGVSRSRRPTTKISLLVTRFRTGVSLDNEADSAG